MKQNQNTTQNYIAYCNTEQAIFPSFIGNFFDVREPVITFDKLMGEIDLSQYLDCRKKSIGRTGYNPVNLLKTVLFGFMDKGNISLRELEQIKNIMITHFVQLTSKQTKTVI